MRTDTKKIVDRFVSQYSEDELCAYLEKRISGQYDVLTIIGDRTLHKIQEDLIEGTVFDFNNGSIDASSDDAVKKHMISALMRLYDILKSRNWGKVKLIYSGHALFTAHIKIMVYRILHLDTVDVAFFGADGYRTVSINLREEISKISQKK